MSTPINKKETIKLDNIPEDEPEIKDPITNTIAHQIIGNSQPKPSHKRSIDILDDDENFDERRKVSRFRESECKIDNGSSQNQLFSYSQHISASRALSTSPFNPPIAPENISNSTTTPKPLETPPNTPPRTTSRYIPIPPTPRRGKKIDRPKFPFTRTSQVALSENPGAIEKWIKLLDPKNQCDRILHIQGFYDLDRPLLCIKQPPQKQSCGAGAALMLISHLIPNNPKLLKEEFWEWYCSVSLASTEIVMTALREKTCLSDLNLSVKGIYFNRQSTVDIKNKFEQKFEGYSFEVIQRRDLSLIHRLDQLQEENGNSPLIISITNPEIDGHWIVIDKFDHKEERVYLRDPFSGQAYAISYEELYRNWPEDDEVKVIYLAPNRKSSAVH